MSPTFTGSATPVAPGEYLDLSQKPIASIVEQITQQVSTNDNNDCSKLNNSQFQFVTVNKPAGNAVADVQVKLARPTTFIMVASVPGTHNTDSLFFHLAPIGALYSTVNIFPGGGEPWICFSELNYTGINGMVGKWIEFCQPIDTFYLDIGHEGPAGAYQITLLCDDRLKAIQTRP